MTDQYFGHKELYEVVLRAKNPMQFGTRYIEADEPVLYFNNVNMSLLTEQNRPIFARGGWGNMPRVIWEDRQEVQFQMMEGVMSSVGMGILLSANVTSQQEDKPLYIHMKEGPLECSMDNVVQLKHWPVRYPEKKTFIFDYEYNAIQGKKCGREFYSSDPERNEEIRNLINQGLDSRNNYLPRVAIFNDKNYEEKAENNRKYIVDYYYKYEKEVLIYSIEKERFKGLFTLEAKFYSQDENEGHRYTNILYMPKVRVVSNINLRLGERADPTVSTFNIIGLPETVGNYKNLIMDITRLDEDIDASI